MAKGARVFYGWWIVVAVFIALLTGLGIGFYTFGVLFKYWLKEFGWTRFQISGARSAFSVASGFSGPLAGKLTDLYGSRWIMTSGALLLGGAYIFLSSVSRLWQLYLIYALLGVGFASLAVVPSTTAISRWFKKKRATAMGIAMVGFGMGGFLLPPFSNYLYSTFGWRQGCIILGTILLFITAPIVGIIMRKSPEVMGLKPDGEEAVKISTHGESLSSALLFDLTAKEAFRTHNFWILALCYFLVHGAMVAIMIHLIPFLTDLGRSPGLAASMLGFTLGISIPVRLVYGYLADRIDKKYVLIASYFLLGLGVFLLLFQRKDSMALLYLFTLIFGLGVGGKFVVETVFVAELFGVTYFGTIYGYIYFIQIMGSALGPLLTGYVFDIYQSYHWAFLALSLSCAIAIGGLLLTEAKAAPALATK